MMGKNSRNKDTRSRLLQAAGELFAQKGFQSTTVRQIVERANVNIAAVRYYFRGKEGLYAATLQHFFITTVRSSYPQAQYLSSDVTPVLRLQTFIRSLLLRILDSGPPAWHGKLMIREITDPSPMLNQVIDEMFRPLHATLISIIADLLEKDQDEEIIQLCAMSIMGLCLFYLNSRPIVVRLLKKEYSLADIEMFADHIASFSLNAMQGVFTLKESPPLLD